MIVCTDPAEFKGHSASKFNPFDFDENSDRTWVDMKDGEILDSRIPLVRLTHLLGGIPAPNPGYEEYYVDENNVRVAKVSEYLQAQEEITEESELKKMNSKLLRLVYVPKDCETEKKAQKQWMKDHYLPVVSPTEIILAFARDQDDAFDAFDSVKMSWKQHMEIDSSKFWERNTYPQNCRFLVFDFSNRGIMCHKEELFKFWCGVLLLSVNRVDPDLIQAHRLYKIDVILNEKELKDSFETTAAKINTRKYQLEQQVERDRKVRINSNDDIPDYAQTISVNFKQSAPKSEKEAEYGLYRDDNSNDLYEWKRYRDSAIGSVSTMIRRTERVLDKAATEYREICTYKESDVEPLNEFQAEEMELSLSEVYHRILQDQKELPSTEQLVKTEIEKADKEVMTCLRRRVTRREVYSILILLTLTLVLFSVSGFFTPGVNRIFLGVYLGMAVILVYAIVYICLILQHKELGKTLTDFRSGMMTIISIISQNAGKYSAFISDICTHVHGRSYLDIMDDQKRSYTNEESMKLRQIKEIDLFKDTLSLWNTALHLNANIERGEVSVSPFREDVPEGRKITELDAGKNYRIPVGRSGFEIISPYGFVKRLEIDREENYDDILN
ncbi:MAG: hypothetical protein IKG46_12785 [Solobacterium sp.]|nr:hypothetical protein [Solobacterium sp.]